MRKQNVIVYGILAFIGIIFLARLFYLQIINDKYKFLSDVNARRSITLYPSRGYIYDRNKVLLAANQISFDLMVIPSKVKDLDTATLCNLLNIKKTLLVDRLTVAKEYSRYKPSLVIDKISKEQFAYLQEHLRKFRGFYIQRKSIREYPLSHAPNVLGYTSEASDRELAKDEYYQKGDIVGVSGIEKSYETQLRGRRGVKYVQVDALDRVKGSYQEGEYDQIPEPGSDITLSIDIALQSYGERLMNKKRGGIVAIEPSTGEILAMVSSPTFDLNLLIGKERSDNYRKLLADTLWQPLFDRSILGEYPPGSTFKVVTGLVGLQQGVITPESKYYCNGGFYSGRRFVKCHCGANGRYVDLDFAIFRSCNTYFSQVYINTIEKNQQVSAGYVQWENYMKEFGFGRFLNNDLPTGRKGFVPTAAYYDNIYGKNRWRATYHISNAFGQGEILMTPIQLANMGAIIANRGHYYIPHVIKEIGGKPIENSVFKNKNTLSIDTVHFGAVIEGMSKVFTRWGGGYYFRIPDIEMCGKTGTSQNPHGDDHSVFVGFAPKYNPKIVVATIVENGHWGSKWAGPISSLMIEKYLNKKVLRTHVEQRMIQGSLEEEYKRQIR